MRTHARSGWIGLRILAALVLFLLPLTARGQATDPNAVFLDALRAGRVSDALIELAPTQEILDRIENLGSSDPAIRAQQLELLRSQISALRERFLAEHGRAIEVLRTYEFQTALLARVRTPAAVDLLINSPLVLHVRPDTRLKPFVTQSLPLIRQPDVARLGLSGRGSTVAVLDTGVAADNALFGQCTAPGVPASCMVSYWADMTAQNDGMLDDATRHGTNVAAVIRRTAPEAKLVALDVFDGDTAPTSAVRAGLDWVIANYSAFNIVAVNLSLGINLFSQQCPNSAYATPVRILRVLGVVTVAASGNEGSATQVSDPACVPDVVSVGAVYDERRQVGNHPDVPCSDRPAEIDRVACFSNAAPFLTITAPGAWINAFSAEQVGTSFAAPFVSAAVALLKSAAPELTVNDLRARLLATPSQSFDPKTGSYYPRLDLYAALEPYFPDTIQMADLVTEVFEADGTAAVRVTRIGLGRGPVEVDIVTRNGTAVASRDYVATTRRLGWAHQETGTKSIPVPLIDNAQQQCHKSFYADLQNASANALINVQRAITEVTMLDDDPKSPIRFRSLAPTDNIPGRMEGFLLGLTGDNQFVYTTGPTGTVYMFRRDPQNGSLFNLGYQPFGNSVLRATRDLFSSATGDLLVAINGDAVAGGPGPAIAAIFRRQATGDIPLVAEAPRRYQDRYGSAGALSPDDRFLLVGVGPQLIVYRIGTPVSLAEFQRFQNGVGGVAGMNGSRGIAIAPDGGAVLVAGSYDNAIAIFGRDPASGVLTFNSPYRHSDMMSPLEIRLSASGTDVYVASTESLNHLVFDPQRRSLTMRQTFRNGTGGITGMNNPAVLNLSADQRRLYVASFGPAGQDRFSLLVFDREATGLLSFKYSYPGDLCRMGDRRFLSVSSSTDGRHLYVSSENSLQIFDTIRP